MYRVVLAKSNNDFMITYQDYLIKNIAKMQLFYLNLTTSDLPIDIDHIRGGIYNDDKLSIIFLNATPFNMQLVSLDQDLEAFDCLAYFILDNNVDVRGFQGTLFDCTQIANSINFIKSISFKINLGMDIMVLNKLNEYNPTGKILKASDKYHKEINEFMAAFYLEALGETFDEPIMAARVRDFEISNYSYIYLNDKGIPTSIIKIVPSIPGAFRISLVYTAKQYRNNGYAKSMVYLACQKYINDCDFITLFVDKNNPISNKVYKDIGFEVLIENYDLRIIKK